MLKKMLTRARMQHKTSIESWEEAVKLASKPLLTEGVIEETYIQNMINSVYDKGPYIVLGDYFALPHAQAGEGVRQAGMALLQLDNPVDLEGKPVKLFLVLAAVDSTTHLNALSEISELLIEKEDFNLLLNGSLDEISKRINTNKEDFE